jgi:transposase
MLAEKECGFQPCVVSLEALVPDDNFYREVEAKLDLSFVRDLVRDCYSIRMGRPSVDPLVFFKLQLIMFFEGIRSERQLMDMVNMRLDHRWLIRYDLNEPVPNHSSLSKIRDRFGLEVFQRFFEHIVELCIEAGLVWGKARHRSSMGLARRAPICFAHIRAYPA